MTQKLSDYVANCLVAKGITQMFMVSGGGSMHLNNSFGTHPSLNCVFNHHEQACTMAAESYFRLSGRLAAVNVTTGPGGTNAITGVHGAWTDSIGMLVISGQVKWETTVQSTDIDLRQLGDQEVDIIELIQSITKYSVRVNDPTSIRYHIDKAIYLAKSGRPGPCWLDIPMNVQASIINNDELTQFDQSEIFEPWTRTDVTKLSLEVVDRINRSKRPVILAGSGIRLSGSVDEFHNVVNKLKIPVTTAWNSHDLIANDHPLYAGRPGTIGTRAGNFSVQNSDLLLILGSRLNIRQVSYEWKSFAREAFKIWVDIDQAELKKPTIQPDLPIHANLSEFLRALSLASSDKSVDCHTQWVEWCKSRVQRYPILVKEHETSALVNPYYFVDTLTRCLKETDILVTGDGTACVVTFQAAIVKNHQRIYTNSGCAAMGYDLPAAIGASCAEPEKDIVCLAGDGSIMLNLQELETISGQNLPIKIFLLNNNGYASIAQTQINYFNGVEVGCSPSSGLSLPNFEKIAHAFNIPYCRVGSHQFLSAKLQSFLSAPSPSICEVMLDPQQSFTPKLSSKQLPDGKMVSSPLEDMWPFLTRDELNENMLIPLYQQ